MSEFRPVTDLHDLLSLDDEEMAAGYWAGHAGDPEPGNTHSRAYWHGWKNGAADAGFRRTDKLQKQLYAVVQLRILYTPLLQ